MIRPDDDPLGQILELFDEAGYVGVVATNCEQTYHRYLRPGEDVSVAAELTDVVGPKQTALGEGFFITPEDHLARSGDEDVAEMIWRILKFRPERRTQLGTRRRPVPDDLDADSMMRPASSQGHQVLLGRRQRARTAHPEACATAACSIRRCPRCGPTKESWRRPIIVVASGKGTVFSFVVHHAPKVPGRTLPFVIALVELEEGVRMLGELRNVDPATVEIGMPVRATYIDFPEGDVRSGVDAVRMGARHVSAPVVEVGTKLPELTLYGDPTFIVSTAIATRDYQDVHHDRDKAQAKGSKDIFVNILTDTGLVQRYITDWAGPDRRHQVDRRCASVCRGTPTTP